MVGSQKVELAIWPRPPLVHIFVPVTTRQLRSVERNKWWTLAIVSLAQLLVMVDTTVINVAMPSVQRSLRMSPSDAQWMISAYTVAFGGFLLLGGRAGDRFGHRPTLLIGLFTFAVASALAGSAPDGGVVIVGRAVQGLASALLTPVTLALIAVGFTNEGERTKALGIFGTIALSGGVVGLIIGGGLVQLLGWRWCMYFNIPVALGAMAPVWLLSPSDTRHRATRLDWWSAIMCTVGLAMAAYGLSATVGHGWYSGYVVWPLVAALVLLVGFVARQRLVRNPLLPMTIFRSRRRVSAYLTMGVVAFAMFGVWACLTYQFQTVMGYSPLATGLAFAPVVIGNVIGANLLPHRMLRRANLAHLLIIRLLVSAAGVVLLVQITPGTSYWAVLLPAELLLGYGAGIALPEIVDAAVRDVSVDDSGIASAMFQTSQLIGASLGTATLTTIAVGVAATDPVSPAAVSHGYAIAAGGAAAVLVMGALVVGLLFYTAKSARLTEWRR